MSTPPPSLEKRITSRTEYLHAVETLIAEAQDSLIWLDPSFKDCGVGSSIIYERLSEFLRGSRRRQLRFLMSEIDYLEKRCPRFRLLQDRFGSQIACRRLVAHGKQPTPVLVADIRHLVHRLEQNGWRGLLALDHPAKAEPLALNFEMLWDESEPCLPMTTLGL